MEDFLEGICNGSLIEVFATGTVAIINPIRNIYFDGKIRLIGGTTSDFNASLSHRFFKSLWMSQPSMGNRYRKLGKSCQRRGISKHTQ